MIVSLVNIFAKVVGYLLSFIDSGFKILKKARQNDGWFFEIDWIFV